MHAVGVARESVSNLVPGMNVNVRAAGLNGGGRVSWIGKQKNKGKIESRETGSPGSPRLSGEGNMDG